MQNAFVESSNGRFCDECLNASLFVRLADEIRAIAAWRLEYNRHRPHSALAGLQAKFAPAPPWPGHNEAMQSGERDGAAVRIPPPLIYLGAIAAGVLARLLAPLRLPLGAAARIGVATAAAALGIAAIGNAIGLFRRSGQDPKPWEPTPEILTTGVYRYTRNPMYVGMALLQSGIGVGLANGWIVLFVPVAMGLVYWTAIRHEEAYLTRKFGAVYEDYRRTVRRWL